MFTSLLFLWHRPPIFRLFKSPLYICDSSLQHLPVQTIHFTFLNKKFKLKLHNNVRKSIDACIHKMRRWENTHTNKNKPLYRYKSLLYFLNIKNSQLPLNSLSDTSVVILHSYIGVGVNSCFSLLNNVSGNSSLYNIHITF